MSHLQPFDADWPIALNELSAEMNPVDRDACLLWFQFFPLGLHNLLEATPDHTLLHTFYQFKGTYRLSEIADKSHRFLYGHRYWSDVKRSLASPPKSSLVETIRAVAAQVPAPAALSLPISAIGVMTLRQAGPDFLSTPYTPRVPKQTPEQVLKARATDAKTGFFAKPKPRVIYDEQTQDGWFPLVPGQHITTAAELDKRPHHLSDPRCSVSNGPIPVDCRSGSCGTCWVGVLGGKANLAPVDDFERKRMAYFGYWESPLHNPADERPLIRLACQTIASATCTVVIPPWNGVWSKVRRDAAQRQ